MPYSSNKFCPLCQTLYQSSRCHCRDRYRPNKEIRRLYSSDKWHLFRQYILSKRPICEECERKGITTGKELELHHKIKAVLRPDLFFVEANIEVLCKVCHSKKTQQGE